MEIHRATPTDPLTVRQFNMTTAALGIVNIGQDAIALSPAGATFQLGNTHDIGFVNFAGDAIISAITVTVDDALQIGAIHSGNGNTRMTFLAPGMDGAYIEFNRANSAAGSAAPVIIRTDVAASTLFYADPQINGDAGGIGFGTPASGNAFFLVDQPATTALANNPFYRNWFSSGNTITVPTGTASIVATLRIDEPNITATGTVTEAFSLYVPNAPTEAGKNGAAYFGAAVSLANGIPLRGRNTSNVDVNMLHVDASDLVVLNGTGTTPVKYGYPLTTMGGGATVTLGTIGGAGPSVAAQYKWMKWFDSATGAVYVPVWQ